VWDIRGPLSNTVGAGILVTLPTRVDGSAPGGIGAASAEGAVGTAGAGGLGAVRTFGFS
jgi:hypothetical protein